MALLSSRSLRASEFEEDAREDRWKERITRFFYSVKEEFVKTPDLQLSAVEQLPSVVRFREYLGIQLRDLAPSESAKLINSLSSSIGNALHATSGPEKLSGLVAITLLIDLDDGAQSGRTITRVINWLRTILESGDQVVANMAAICLGKVVRIEGTLASECAESEAVRALRWIDGTEKRQTGMMMIKELVANSPTSFFIHVKDFFTRMWRVFHDRSLALREIAAECLLAALRLIQQREDISRPYYRTILDDAQRNIQALKRTEVEPLHGCILVIGALLVNPGGLLDDVYPNIVSLLFQFRDHRDKLIRSTLVTIIPRLCACNRVIFVRDYLADSYEFLVASRTDCEHLVFLALGEMFYSIADDQYLLKIAPYIERTTQLIKQALQPKRGPPPPAVFSCIELLAKTMRSALSAQIHELLPIMFSNSVLTQEFASALTTLSVELPSLLPEIQERLLNVISFTLAQQSFESLNANLLKSISRGGPATSSSMRATVGRSATRTKRKSSVYAPGAVQITEKSILLSLQILSSFDFETLNLKCFVREVVLDYIETEHTTPIRRQSALVAVRLAVHPGETAPTSGKYAPVVAEIVEKLLSVGVTDQTESIRYTIFNSLDSRYDSHLGTAENLQSLFLALNDESFSIREQAISIIGRLAVRNPAYVMPSLRKSLIQLVTELEFSGNYRIQEECCRLLMALLKSAGRLMRPYVPTILAALIPKLHDPSKRVTPTILAACGELSSIAPEDLDPHLPVLFSLCISCLADQGSSQKRLTALRALRQLSQNIGYVIKPYIDYPDLMSTLIGMLKVEVYADLRNELLAVLGVLGAIDPYQLTAQSLKRQAQSSMDSIRQPLTVGKTFSPSVDFFSGESLKELMKILADPSLSVHHSKVVHIMMYICKLLGAQAGRYLPQIMPLFIAAMRSSEKGVAPDFLIQQLGILIQLTAANIVDYLGDIFDLISLNWADNKLLAHLLLLVEKMAISLKSDMKPYLPRLIPCLLTSLHQEATEYRIKILNLLDLLGESLGDYIHLIIPSIVGLFDSADSGTDESVGVAVETIGRLCSKLELGCYASRITHPILRLLAVVPSLVPQAMYTICMLVFQLGSEYATFIPLVNRTLQANNINHPQYHSLVSSLLKNQPMTPPSQAGLSLSDNQLSKSTWTSGAGISRTEASPFIAPEEPMTGSGLMKSTSTRRKMALNVDHLRRAWEASLSSTREDWINWIRRLSVEFLRESPAMALRSCLSLAQFYHPLARALFNAGFVSCWTELQETDRQQLSKNMKIALGAPNAPPEIIQTILDLAECLEHYGMTLAIDTQILGSLAEKSRAYAKALHYKELAFRSSPAEEIENETIQALISINNMLGQPEAARGILAWALKRTNEENIQEAWYESLHRWESALAAYERKQRENPGSLEATIGRMRCLDALGDWDRLALLVMHSWRGASAADKITIAPMATTAVWNLGRWREMEQYVDFIPDNTSDGAFFRAILAIHEDRTKRAAKFIAQARSLLDTDLTALVGESYHRAYHVMCRVQQLSELEEVVEYRASTELPDRQETIRKIWKQRLLGCQRSVDVWQRLLPVRSLVLSPRENVALLIKFASLCRKAGRMRVSQNIHTHLLGADPSENPTVEVSLEYPEVTYSYFKHVWAANAKSVALSKMKAFVGLISPSHGKLRSKTYLKIGNMELELSGDRLNASNIPLISEAFRQATAYSPEWHRAWHAWALLNFEAISIFEKTDDHAKISQHLVPALHGFFRSITLSITSGDQTLQDTLRLITLWFKYGGHAHAEATLREGFGIVSIGNWLQVIPQIIARIHSRIPEVRKLVKELLHQVGQLHPQALVYPLTVAAGSQSSGDGTDTAAELLTSMREHSEKLVDQAMLVSKELIRVSIVWPEQWYEALEDASRAFFTEKNPVAMLERLADMHKMLDTEPQTLREQAFHATFARDLLEARNWCRRYQQTGVIQDLNASWDLYYGVFRGITRLLPHFKLLDLHFDSPQLLAATDLELALPGSYVAGQPVVRIRSFHPTLTVFASKQRPRKMTIAASNGKDYNFLLKGHEDLRQDERVMQLFGLVNNLLEQDQDTSRYHLSIIRYAAVPLSPNSGLIGWVPNTDTLHDVIKEYRASRGIVQRCEQLSMAKLFDKYDQLTLIQKVELFLRSLEASDGLDIAQSLWSCSPNSEVWLDRRTNYTRSIALMSMVGYILGLGDRHPSNLMIERHTGKVLHIDFGDCFEVAMVRDKYPETVPFRLTRMLVNAMEVSGIEGNFRSTCESVMRVLRESRESLMAVLEAFVHDPLINWRLLATQQASHEEVETEGPEREGEPEAEATEADSSKEEPAAPPTEEDLFPAQIDAAVDPAGAYLGSVLSKTRAESCVNKIDIAESALNARAVQVIERVSSKLRGTDFMTPEPLDVPKQVSRLIDQARSPENLCLLYAGWSASW